MPLGSNNPPSRPMRIFYICQRVPFPPNRGDKITTFNEIRHLAVAHDVHVFCLGDGPEDLDNVPPLLEYVKTVTAVPVTPWDTRRGALKALLTGRPLSVSAYRKAKLHEAIKQKYEELKPDLIFAYSSNAAQYAEHFPSIPRIMQFADLDSLKWGQYAERAAIPMKWLYSLEQRRLLEYERHLARTFSHALVCTDLEQQDFKRLIPGAPVSRVGNGVDLEYFRPQGGIKTRASVIFTGVMDYLPNVDAVVWFCDAVLPIIQAQVPEASFMICGSSPSAAVLELATRPGVTVTGRVPDMRPFLDSAQVLVAPMRMGRGIQNKVLEGLAMGLPCITSIAAWNGTVIPQGEGILATDDPRLFAEHVVRLFGDDPYRADMGRKGRLQVETHYGWDAQLKVLDRVIAQVTRRSSVESSAATA